MHQAISQLTGLRVRHVAIPLIDSLKVTAPFVACAVGSELTFSNHTIPAENPWT